MIPRGLCALLLGAPISVMPATLAAQQPAIVVKPEKASYLKEARLTADSAIRIALARIPGGTVREAELEKERSRLVYSFDIAVAGKAGIDEVLVDAKSGEVIEVSHESPKDEASEQKTEITAGLVKELREKTGAGMMDCKRALGETAGDLEGAVDWLRKKGLAAAAKKAGRIAAEGLVGVATDGRRGAVVEVNSETDFVARNDLFQSFVRSVANTALDTGEDIDKLKAAPFPGSGRAIGDELTHMIATIGENMALRRVRRLEVKSGVVLSYVHSALTPGLGKIGVLVALESTGDAAKLAALGKQLAMHVAAAKPDYLDIASVDAAALERERAVLREQSRASGKPDAIVEKMVEGRLRKFYEEVVLLEQVYVIDGETRIAKVIEAAAKELGTSVRVAGFVRFALGEGIPKEHADAA